MKESFRYKSLSFRISVYAILIVMGVFLTVFYLFDYKARNIILNLVENNASEFNAYFIAELESSIDKLNDRPDNLASYISYTGAEISEIHSLLRHNLEISKFFMGFGVEFDTNMADPGLLAQNPYFFRCGDDSICQMELSDDVFDFSGSEVFIRCKENGKAFWSEPYTDPALGNIAVSTYCTPFFKNIDGKKQFAGVVYADVKLGLFSALMKNLSEGLPLSAFIITSKGNFIVKPGSSLTQYIHPDSLAIRSEKAEIAALVQKMKGGESGFTGFEPYKGKKYHLSYAPVKTSGWSAGLLISDNVLFHDIAGLNKSAYFILITGFLLILLLISLTMRSVMKPLMKLALITREIGRGKLDTEIPSIENMGEVSMLAESFAMMQLSLKQYIASLETSVRQQERIQSELSIARNIQMGMLPAVFPPFPGKPELSLYASITPANEVSGDFYDYFFMDNARLFFCIGDVSGKGIHAALFMMKVKTLTGMVFSGNIASLHEAAEKINCMLSDNNAQMMFVSIIFGILDTVNGSLAMCNCGHNKPYLLSPGKTPYRLDFSNGLPQGIDKQAVYTSASAKLNDGESLFLYTDGLTEATNSRGEFFGEEGLAEVLTTNASADPEKLCKTIAEKTEAFGLNSPRHDDITMLCIRYNGKKTSIHINHKE